MNRLPPAPTLDAPTSAMTEPTGRTALPPFDLDEQDGRRPDRHQVLTGADGRITGRYSLWWRQTPAVAKHRTGLIGHYAAATADDGARVLREACHELGQHGCTLAVGPMDGSTWGNYRFVTSGSDAPPFFLEPTNPPEWPAHFVAGGFTPLAGYHATVVEDLDSDDPKADRAEQRLAAQGIALRVLEKSRLEDELKTVFRISLAAFQRSLLYEPVSEAAFLASYERLTPFIRPELVLIATHGGREIGFLFAIPDLCQARRGESVDTVIIKTIAILPGRQHAGLGVCLFRHAHRTAKALGYRRVIHALMHDSNESLNISRRYSKPFRRYTLFSKTL